MRLRSLTVALLFACGQTPTPATAPPPGAHELLPASPAAAAGSIYDLPLTPEDALGPTTLDRYRGHPVLISMFYTSCPQACPLLIERMRTIEAAVPEPARAGLRMVLVSMDPKNDTREAIAAAAAARGLDTSRWSMMRVPESQVRDLAVVLGVQYRPSADGGFNHSSVVVLLDDVGHIVRRVEGFNQPFDALVDDTVRIAAAL